MPRGWAELTVFVLTAVRPAFEQQHPKALQQFLPDIYAFMEHNQFNVLYNILR